jgi:hypothetical protein
MISLISAHIGQLCVIKSNLNQITDKETVATTYNIKITPLSDIWSEVGYIPMRMTFVL